HADFQNRNVFYNGQRDVSGIIDFEQMAYNYRAIEFWLPVLGGDLQTGLYTRENLKTLFLSYSQYAAEPLDADEIRMAIEVLRFMSVRFMGLDNKTEAGFYEEFLKFADDFSTEQKINDFVNEILGTGVNTVIDEQAMSRSVNGFFTDSQRTKEKYTETVAIITHGLKKDALADIHKRLVEVLGDYAYIFDPEYYHLSVSNNRTGTSVTPAPQEEVLRALSVIPEDFFETLSNVRGKLKGRFDITPNGQIVYILDSGSEIAQEFFKAAEMLPAGWFRPNMIRMNFARMHTKPPQAIMEKIADILNEWNSSNIVAEQDYAADIVYGQLSAMFGRAVPEALSVNYVYRQALAGFNYSDGGKNSNFRLGMAGNNEALSVFDFMSMIDSAADNGFNGFETSMFFHHKTAEGDTTYDYSPVHFWQQKKQGNVPQFTISKVIEEYEKVLAELRDGEADRIKKHAADRNIRISAHLNSIDLYDDNNNVVRPVPFEGSQMYDLFRTQIDIAAMLGIDTAVLHLTSLNNAKGYAELIKYAAGKNIRINFENELMYDERAYTDAFSAYLDASLAGYGSSKDFVNALEGIRNELIASEGRGRYENYFKQYFGVVLDTSKALNSFTAPVEIKGGEISPEERKAIEEQLSNINLENLIAYYNAITDAGFDITQLHLAQFAKSYDFTVSSKRLEAVKRGESERKKYVAFYNKQVMDSRNDEPAFDMIAFLNFLKERNFSGILEQESGKNFVSPASARLTMPLIAKFVNLLPVSAERKESIVAIVETPFMILSFIFPGFAGFFLNKLHRGESVTRKTGFETIKTATKAAWEMTYSRNPLINLWKKIANAVVVQYRMHIEHNLANPEDKLRMFSDTDSQNPFLKGYNFYEMMLNATASYWERVMIAQNDENVRDLSAILNSGLSAEEKMNALYPKIEDLFNRLSDGSLFAAADPSRAKTSIVNLINNILPLSIKITDGVPDFTLFNKLLSIYEQNAPGAQYLPEPALLVKSVYVYGIETGESELLSALKKQLLRFRLSSMTDIYEAYKWANEAFPEFFMKTDGSVNELKKFYEVFLGVSLNIDWGSYQNQRYVPGFASIAGKLPENNIPFSDEMLIVQNKKHSAVTDSSGENYFDLFERFVEYNKIALAELGGEQGNVAMANSIAALRKMMDIVAKFGGQDIYDSAEKQLAEIKDLKDVNAIINYVHQNGIKRMKMNSENASRMLAYKKSSLKTRSGRFGEGNFSRDLVQLEIYNFSDKPLSPDILEFFSGLLLNSDGSGTFFVKDNKVIWDFSIGQHSFYTVIDLQDLNEGLTYVYNEGYRNTENALRVTLFAVEAVQNGMDITHMDVQTNEWSNNPTIPGVCGMNAVYRPSGKITAPKEYSHIINVIYRMMVSTSGIDNRIIGNISDDMMEMYSARLNSKVTKLTDDDFAKLKGTVGSPYMRGNQQSGVSLDYRVSEMLDQRYKARFEDLRNHRVLSDTVYNLLGIYDAEDRNMAEIERRFVEKRIALKYGVLANNENYQPAYDITASLKEGLSDRRKLKKYFEPANVINAAGVENFAFREEAAIGKMLAVSGVLRLKDGYLSVKGLLNPETNSLECAYVEFVSHDGARKTINVKTLNGILKDNGYKSGLAAKEEITGSRINYVLKQINTESALSRIPQIRGLTVSKGSAAGRLTSDKNNPSDDQILMFAQPAPSDIPLISKFNGLIVKLNKLAHSAVLIREEKTPALSVSSSLKDGKTVVSVVRYADEAKTVNGFKVTELNASRRALQDGEYVIISADKAQLFDLLPPWFIDEISRVIRDKDERRLLEIVNWDNREETKRNIAQILAFIYSKTANAEGLIIRQILKDKIDRSSIAGQIIRELDLNTAAIEETLQIVDEMAENAAAIKETDAKKAFTIILHAEDMISELQENGAPKVLQKKAELARLKAETFKYFKKEAKEFISKINETLAAANPDADDIYRLMDIASYWDNFYNYPGISDLVKKLDAKFNELKSLRTDRGRIKTLSELGALDIEDNGSKAVNVARLKRMAELYPDEMKGFKFADGFVLGHSAITAMLEGKTVNGLTYRELIDLLKAARSKEEADYALSLLRELVQKFEIDASASGLLKPGVTYAVRSSGVGEDGNEKSYAGVAETELEIDGNIEAINAAVIKVLLSFFKPSSIEYTESSGYVVIPSVLIQEMVTGVSTAGQIFTADNSGNELMDMVYGLGEGSVSGRVAADDITYKPGADVALYRKADERIMKIVPAENGGTMAVPLTNDEKTGNVLSGAEVKAWLSFSRTAAAEFGYALDMECATDASGVKWPLQARPITTFVKKGYDVSRLVSADAAAESETDVSAGNIFGMLLNTVRLLADKLLLITRVFGSSEIHTLAVRFEHSSKADIGSKEGNDYTVYVVNDGSIGESAGIMMKNDDGESVSVRISREGNKVILSANGVKDYERIIRAVSSSKALKSAISEVSGIKAENLRITSIIENNERGVSFDEGIMRVENGYFNEAAGVSSLEDYMASLSDIERNVIKTLNDKGVLNLAEEENYKAFLSKISEQTGKTGPLEGKIIITAAQYEEFKKDILNESGKTLFDLSAIGIKFYVTDAADKDKNYYAREGFRGIISQNKAYDYITREEIKIMTVKDAQISKNDLAQIFLTYDGMIAVGTDVLRNIDGSIDSFGGAFILQADSLLGKLIGSLFEVLKFNLGEITANDALNMARGISVDKIIPFVNSDMRYDASNTESIISALNLPKNNQISIFLNDSD
ncbi:MAG: hypothetical protein LBR69_04725, partial [Endomicrobium sp.]|nr:hypothetical protein [Endomicrobium sp.]